MLESTASAARLHWSAEGAALVAEALRNNVGSRQTVRLRVHGESMLPTLWPGDVVEIESCSLEDVQPGEIVLAQREDRLFLHRLVSRGTPNGFVMCGDSMPAPDPEYTSEALLGRLVCREEAGRFSEAILRRGMASNWLGLKSLRAVGILLCYSSMARTFALKFYRRRNTWARGPLSAEAAAERESL
jgi:hypothetical protein